MSVADWTVAEYLEELASPSVPPGGGTAAAIGGATAAALGEMVCTITVRDDEYADVADELAEVRESLSADRGRLVELAGEDAEAIEEMMAAYRADEGRDEAIQAAMERATEVPLAVAESCLDVIERAVVVTDLGNRNAVADGGIGAFLAHGALQASAYTVEVNLATLDDEAFVAETESRLEAVAGDAETALERVQANLDDAY